MEAHKIQEALNAKGFSLKHDGIWGKKSEAALLEFAAKNKVSRVDALRSLEKFMAALEKPVLLKFVECPADALDGGYDHLWLREDIAEKHCAVYNLVHLLGGVLTSSGGKRGLVVKAGKAQSTTSMHYLGRAGDNAVPSAMNDPLTDTYVLERPNPLWEVWCKSSLSADELKKVCAENSIRYTEEVTAVKWGGKKVGLVDVEYKGSLFSLTDCYQKQGFSRIPPRSPFKTGTTSAAEWWHSSYTVGLIPGKTTFGSELLKVYSLADAQQFVYWEEVKDKVWSGKAFV